MIAPATPLFTIWDSHGSTCHGRVKVVLPIRQVIIICSLTSYIDLVPALNLANNKFVWTLVAYSTVQFPSMEGR